MLTPTQYDGLSKIAAASLACEKITGCAAELSASQAVFESNYLLVAPGNNCFGIKPDHHGVGVHYSLTHEYLNGQWKEMPLAFESYATLTDCFTDHARLLQVGRYAPVWQQYVVDKNLDGLVKRYMPDLRNRSTVRNENVGGGALHHDPNNPTTNEATVTEETRVEVAITSLELTVAALTASITEHAKEQTEQGRAITELQRSMDKMGVQIEASNTLMKQFIMSAQADKEKAAFDMIKLQDRIQVIEQQGRDRATEDKIHQEYKDRWVKRLTLIQVLMAILFGIYGFFSYFHFLKADDLSKRIPQ